MDAEDLEFRKLLISTQHRLNDSYDKLVVTLSGGALALSITFLKDIITLDQAHHTWMLGGSWALFIASLALILGEILFGIEAYKIAVNQLDQNTIRDEKVGGLFAGLTKWSSRLAAIALILGLLTISIFIFLNVRYTNEQEATATTAEAAKPAIETVSAGTESAAI